MKTKYCLILIIIFMIFVSCRPFKYYKILNSNKREYIYHDKILQVTCGFSAKYSLTIWGIASYINVKIHNNSSKEVIFESQKATLFSNNFNYKNTTSDYSIIIHPGENDEFILSFHSYFQKINDSSNIFKDSTISTMPENEKSIFHFNCIKVDEAIIKIPPIGLVSEK